MTPLSSYFSLTEWSTIRISLTLNIPEDWDILKIIVNDKKNLVSLDFGKASSENKITKKDMEEDSYVGQSTVYWVSSDQSYKY